MLCNLHYVCTPQFNILISLLSECSVCSVEIAFKYCIEDVLKIVTDSFICAFQKLCFEQPWPEKPKNPQCHLL